MSKDGSGRVDRCQDSSKGMSSRTGVFLALSFRRDTVELLAVLGLLDAIVDEQRGLAGGTAVALHRQQDAEGDAHRQGQQAEVDEEAEV